MNVEKPDEMLSLPGPRIVSLPAIRDRRLNDLCLAYMTLACGMRSGQDGSQEKLDVEWLTHVLPPI